MSNKLGCTVGSDDNVGEQGCLDSLNNLAPEVGFEPTTLRLTAAPEAV
jgi:hypothetical protein